MRNDMTENASPLDGLKVDSENLYKEEIITDLKVGTIRKLTPITVDGGIDASRTALFTGETQIMTQAGPLPVNSKLEANTMEEAITVFPQAMRDAVSRLMEEVQEHQRKEASKIVVPGAGSGGRIEMP